jgi:hypothetical protein
MAKAKRVQTTATLTQSEVPAELPDTDAGRLYGVAMLKMALELKKPGTVSLETVISQVLTRMRLQEEPFRRYLAQNGGLLKAIAERRV